jgi:hypothetical protein
MTQREYNEFSDEPMDDEYPDEFDELFFDDDESPERAGEEQSDRKFERQLPPKRAQEAGLTGGALPENYTTQDDMSPETLITEDGARSSKESGGEAAADQQLREASAEEIGAGTGLDEAELGRARPLDERPWDGSHTEPLNPNPTENKNFSNARQPQGGE